ncbi:glycerol-3-phosphate 1-O-acyltransferase PlsY [Pseudomonas sp. GX19020]|uniref:glycerol-3-phosphate 1-O-acyltransferase PlsY n=1 Tax=Pseudomonadota TaxID=1224 RepID=UPI00089C336F|nr:MULTISPECIES: glycerol-3-phosphate 1-O-acyltransferase PlsY [Pseudomonadota]MCL4069152.1 glycerol-3-phosphate 1-O-acyltransferase PlsY [Pseudomonas sp. GX19020]SEC37130.1 acyl-phosphate glycerol-3-phosphate acyltransferase [Rhodobacter sp. 24-YEA-8]
MPDFVTGRETLILVAILAYLLGSVPFGVLITRVMGLGDLRQIGSGNIGATNVLRTGNKAAALATLLLDGGKGALAVILARCWAGAEDAAQIAALAAFLGHLFPIWSGFRGGKGVATFLGILLALAPPVGILTCLTWLIGAIATRMSSAAALIAAALTPLWVLIAGMKDMPAWIASPGAGRMLILVVLLTVLIYIRHAANLKRIKSGTEPKIGGKKT